MTFVATYRATDVRAIVGNLFAFFEANQDEALALASPDAELEHLNIYRTAEVRLLTDFPHMGLVRRRVVTNDADDGLRIRYDLTLELEVMAEHTKETRTDALAALQETTDNYVYAVETMILNIPPELLLNNVAGAWHKATSVTGNDPLEVAVSDTRSLFNTQIQIAMEIGVNPYAD